MILDTQQSLDKVYLEYYRGLHHYAYTILNDNILAEDMVHQVFFKILDKNESINIHTSLKAYLYRSVNNECLNYLKHRNVRNNYEKNMAITEVSDSSYSKVFYSELESRLKKAINELPEQCRTIFQLSRYEDLKYNEIAIQLGLSIKTVETQMSRALKKLRVQLTDYLPLYIWILVLVTK